MEEKFIDKKKEAEKNIHNILKNFEKDTGVSINYVDFSEKTSTGFNTNSEKDSETKIILKND